MVENESNKGEKMEYLNLRDIQLEELKIAKAIDVFCKENDIKYYLSSGSLLGAVRHGGFIPWDDDMDLCMLRDDYDRFCQTFSDKKYILKYCENGTLHAPFAKVCNPEIAVKSEIMGDEDNSLLWVDIFPVDGLSNNKIMRLFNYKRISRLMRLIMVQRTAYIPRKNCFKDIYRRIEYKIVNSHDLNYTVKLSKKISRLSRKYPVLSSQYLGSDCFHAIYPKKLFEKQKQIEFEGELFYAFEDTDMYLTTMYGDYMTLPPVGCRETHGLKAYRL